MTSFQEDGAEEGGGAALGLCNWIHIAIQAASSGSWRNEVECDIFTAAGAHDEDEDEHHEDDMVGNEVGYM